MDAIESVDISRPTKKPVPRRSLTQPSLTQPQKLDGAKRYYTELSWGEIRRIHQSSSSLDLGVLPDDAPGQIQQAFDQAAASPYFQTNSIVVWTDNSPAFGIDCDPRFGSLEVVQVVGLSGVIRDDAGVCHYFQIGKWYTKQPIEPLEVIEVSFDMKMFCWLATTAICLGAFALLLSPAHGSGLLIFLATVCSLFAVVFYRRNGFESIDPNQTPFDQ